MSPTAAWPGAREVAHRTIDGVGVVTYREDAPRGSDPFTHRDGRGRLVLEALTAIQLHGELADGAATVAAVVAFGPLRIDGLSSPSFARSTETETMAAFWGPDPLQVVVESLADVADELAALSLACDQADAIVRHPDTPGSREWLAGRVRRRLRVGLAFDVGADGRFAFRLQPFTLVDVGWWQLANHCIRRPMRYGDGPGPVFRLPRCGVCDGVILSTRLVDDRVNKWHPGCKAAGQARARRARQKEARDGTR